MRTPTREELDRLAAIQHHDPHAILGKHPAKDAAGKDGFTFRAFHPDSKGVELQIDGIKKPVTMNRIHDGGIFEAFVAQKDLGKGAPSYRYRFQFSDGNDWVREDPYRFLPTLGDLDIYLSAEGRHWRLYEKFGAQVREIDGIAGTSFVVWAPNATRVSVVGNFNRWDERLCPMRVMGNGIWELFIPGLGEGELYKFAIRAGDGTELLKLDPFAFYCQKRPDTAGIIWKRGKYQWSDKEWMKDRAAHNDPLHKPMATYEIHLGSWMRSPDNPKEFLGYRVVAPMLVEHCLKYGFNFVEFLPLAEHPFDGSWGYQVTGYFAPTSRFGNPDDFKYLVDALHRAGIGVIVDWVPAHFPKDAHGLRRFDGTALYEHADPRLGEHMDWGTHIFNFARYEVSNFLISNALYWLEEYHIDGLRVDAVASMLYLDYSRKEGQWIPNKYGGRENLDAIAFLRQLNEQVHVQYPGAFTIAEESTAFPGVSRPTYVGGLGFTLKWNMGWMHDTLEYVQKEPIHRRFHQNDLTFSMIYAYTENFCLPISHDEVVHGKGSLLARMPGDEWQKFANYRLFLAYMWTHPGKKLLFMGSEFAQGPEWNFEESLHWHQAGHPMHKGVERFLEDMGKFYRGEEALWKYDSEPRGFSWIDCSDWESSVLAFLRWADNAEHVIVVCNFTPVLRKNYRVGVPWPCFYQEVLNSDSAIYGGSNQGNMGGLWADDWARHGHYHSINVTLPPLSCVVFKPVPRDKA